MTSSSEARPRTGGTQADGDVTISSGDRDHPDRVQLLKAAGRLAVSLGWADAGTAASLESVSWLERALAGNTTDSEVEYYLGVAVASAGRPADARRLLESSQRFRTTNVASSLELARLLARQGRLTDDPALRR